jgi:coproporphyrinogen III oxidase
MDDKPNIDIVVKTFLRLQSEICERFEEMDTDCPFVEETWTHTGGGGGRTRIIQGGHVFDKGGVNFSHVTGCRLPESATAKKPVIEGKPFEASGVSIVMHPRNPFVPTSHMNVRFFIADADSDNPVWWFGGGYDLTPYYGFVDDCVHWHTTAREACDKFDENYYADFKARCDQYFYLPHRKEARGIGGLFFDDFCDRGFDSSLAFVETIGLSYIDAYVPIVEMRYAHPFNDEHKEFQNYRRGRYVEFNLLYDRGTLFGLQSGGRTESILMSLPPRVEWKYGWRAQPGSEEESLVEFYLQPRDWASMTAA